jgi:hypothetical protein
MGLTASPTLIAAQSSVEWENRGVVTGTNMFARSMGSAMGIAAFGAIANAAMGGKVGGHVATTAASVPVSVLAPAVHEVFLGAGVVALVLTAAIAAMPRGVRT